MPRSTEERTDPQVERYLTFARHALGRRHLEEAAGHYDYVHQLAEDNMEAIFYSAYCRTVASLNERDYAKREACFAALTEAILGVEAAYPTTGEDKESVLTRINARMRGLADIPFSYEEETDGVGGLAWEKERIDAAEKAFRQMLVRLADAQNDPLPRRLASNGPHHDAQWNYRMQDKRYEHDMIVGLLLGGVIGVVSGTLLLLAIRYFGGADLLPLGMLAAAACLTVAPFLGYKFYR